MVAYIDVFILAQSNFEEWLRVWRMDASERSNNNDLLALARATEGKFTDLIENEIKKFKSVKLSLRLKVKFSIERNSEMQYIFYKTTNHTFSTDLNTRR